MSLMTLYAWLTQLARRYEAAAIADDASAQTLRQHLPGLRLASATLDKLYADQATSERQAHIAVLGPTQSGKSSLVNTLLDTHAASVSPLAGFTVHAQGYAATIDDVDLSLVDTLMAPFNKTQARALDSKVLDTYAFEQVLAGENALTTNAVIWDTPDFDSIDAVSYSTAVLKTAALADMVVVVASKDKYGDKRVWDMLDLLIPLGKPLLFCINKVDEADRSVIESAFRSRYVKQFGESLPVIVLLPFIKNTDDSKRLPLDVQTRQVLQDALSSVRNMIDKDRVTTQWREFVLENQANWLEPLAAELNAQRQWQQLVDAAVDKADEYYAQNYLNNPDKYETFNRTLAELLTLLEIPGVAPAFAQARKLITWPARKLLGVGQSALGKKQEPKLDASGQVMDQEALILEHIFDNTVVSLQRELMEAPTDPLWQLLDQQLRLQVQDIRIHFESGSEKARHEFAPEIERTARSLYEQLQTQPALLNTLRAARASADAAGVALAVKTGGLAPTDLILAPAMLSVTTLLTESALGRYLETVKRELKQRQRDHIRQSLLEQILAADLADIPSKVDAPGLLSVNIEPELDAHVAHHFHQETSGEDT